VITNNQSVSVTLDDQGDAPVDAPVVEPPSDNMGALIDLTVRGGSDEGLFLNTPDLSATEDAVSTVPPDSTEVIDTPEANPTANNTNETATPADTSGQGSDSQPTSVPPDTNGDGSS